MRIRIDGKREPSKVEKALLLGILIGRQGGCCLACGVFIHLTIDHVEARRDGNVLHLMNIQGLCRDCNSRKGARRDEKFDYRKPTDVAFYAELMRSWEIEEEFRREHERKEKSKQLSLVLTPFKRRVNQSKHSRGIG